MSVEATAWVLRHKVGDTTAKVILWGIADHADRYGTNSYPSQETLADYAEVTRETVNRKVKWLVENGWIEVERRSSREGRKSNCYTIVGMQLSENPSQPLSDKSAQLSDPAASQEPSVEPSVFANAQTETAAPSRAHDLVKFYFDHAKVLNRYTPQAHAPILIKQIGSAKKSGVTDYDVQGGIKLLLAKGFGPEALPRFITEYQATRTPPPKEGGPLWDETYEPQTPEQNERDALKALNELFGPASTADSPPPDSPAKGTTTSPS